MVFNKKRYGIPRESALDWLNHPVEPDELRAQIAELLALRGQGIKRIQENEREVEYRSDAELDAAIKDLERRLAALTRPRVHIIKIFSSKGV